MERLQLKWDPFKEVLEAATVDTFEFYAVNSRTAAAEALRGETVDFLVSGAAEYMVIYALSLGLRFLSFVVLLIFRFTSTGLMLAVALFGMGDGIKTIARGTLSLALFGAKGCGARLGWISFVQMDINASAPFAFAWTAQTFGGWWSSAVLVQCLCCAVATYIAIAGPRRHRNLAA